MTPYPIEILYEGVLSCNHRLLAKAISLIESTRPQDRSKAHKLLSMLLPHTGKSWRIGITGAPGVGKSTMIETLGLKIISEGHRIAVITIDPSSQLSGGSILGDKTRMSKLSNHNDVFIRPAPSGGALGGVNSTTREVMLICEAAGFDVVIVETVGVGQSETEVESMVDMFMALMMPNAGDELQGIKRGIMEITDLFVITKADGATLQLANLAKAQIQASAKLLRHKYAHWSPKILTSSALENIGIDEVWQCCKQYFAESTDANVLSLHRAKQNQHWLHQLLEQGFREIFYQFPPIKEQLPAFEQQILDGRILPTYAAEKLLGMLTVV
ncbi:MAG: methylmalonyl Co-A mutase-associated GTPase MeaB [Ignavibacteriae bacterium]|nr:methylmalonyl Co-A mutase-associated GTPase MeaB [Ignavibacteriota bacterium]